MISERMALLLDLWNSLMLGILYLAFQAFPIIFEDGHGFTVEQTGLSFLGIGLGMVLALVSQPIWNRSGHILLFSYLLLKISTIQNKRGAIQKVQEPPTT